MTSPQTRRPAARPPAAAKRTRRRMFVLLALCSVVFAVIAARLAWIQVFGSASYAAYGNNQEVRTVVLPGLRGAILDRQGHDLALSELRPEVVADPYQITNPAGEAASLARMLPVPASQLAQDLRRPTGYVVLASNLANSVGAAVTRARLAGITVEDQPPRVYPAAPLAAPLIGSIGASGRGTSGLEYQYNQALTGRPGRMVERVDPQGQPIPDGTLQNHPAVPGEDLALSIDEPLQYQAEQAVAQAIVESKAQSGMALVMDRRTGALLAVADLQAGTAGGHQTPAIGSTIGPNGTLHPRSSTALGVPQPVEASTALAFTKVYEPGSVEKLVTVSAALSQGVVTPGEVFTIPNGYPVAGTTFHDAETHGDELLSLTGILAQSSNIGAIQIGQRLGAPELYRYLAAYGLTQPTAVHFPGESAGLRPALGQLSGTSLATMSFGEGMSVTAVQMLAAYNTIANGGVYVPPHLVDGLVEPNGKLQRLPEPAGHRVVAAAVASEMTPMLEQVVSAGTGTAAKVAAYAVAGKTGTANLPSPTGGYQVGKVTSSFAGYAPAQNPAVTVMVVISGTDQYGAQAAAPAFATLTADALHRLEIPSGGPQPPAEASASPQPLAAMAPLGWNPALRSPASKLAAKAGWSTRPAAGAGVATAPTRRGRPAVLVDATSRAPPRRT
ncbi:MAG: peptidoglycan D,D-transpeptidase FtsI family protein [Acidimicrobiales bacterium]